MSRATISTGSIPLYQDKNSTAKRTPPAASGADPLHILIMANFSGRHETGVNPISTGKCIEIDRDNFDDVFSALNVQFASSLTEEPICFNELDDMHPDFIYERIPLFAKFRGLKHRLKDRNKFDAAAQEIMGWSEDVAPATSSDPATATATSTDQTAGYGDSLLDSILAQAPTPSGPDYDIEQLVKSIVTPFVQPKADPRQKEMLAVVDEAVSDLMRKIMHHSRFQALESSWRALYQLTKKLETDNRLKVFILDTDLDAVIEDAGTSETLEASQLYKKIISERQTEGGTPFRVILADYTFHPRADHLAAATHCIHLAQSSGGTLLSSASPAWAGCDSLDRTPDPDDWQSLPENDVMASWQQVRAMPGSEHAAFYGVRHMLRLPYGKRTAPTREFEFEELPANNVHNYYLWASGAWLGTLMIAEQYSQSGWQIQTDAVGQIDGFPMHVYTEDGETVTTPCAEIYLTDAASKRLHDAGLAVLRSIQNKDSIIIPGINSIKPNTSLHGGWTR